MLNGKAMIIPLTVGLIEKTYVNEWILSKIKIFRSKYESWIRSA